MALSPQRLVRLLQVAWVIVLVYGELVVFHNAVFRCKWPELSAAADGPNAHAEPHRVLMVTDPQLTDFYSYGMAEHGLALALTQYYSDAYMRLMFRVLQRMSPRADTVFMMGDMFDGGRILNAEQYAAHVQRFEHVFEHPADMPMYNATGNHDVGLGSYCSPQATRWFEDSFGPVNYFVMRGNFSFVVINSPALYSNSVCPAEHDDTKEFIAAVKHELTAQRDSQATPEEWAAANSGVPYASMAADAWGRQPASPAHFPRVLVSHIPLDRPQGSDCGAERGHRSLHEGYGVSYRNLMSREDTEELLDSVRPVKVFSGDDHDVCRYVHKGSVFVTTEDASHTYERSPEELTVGTISWLQGERRPSVALMSLLNVPGEPFQVETVVCRLPDQIAVYEWYGIFGAVSLAALLVNAAALSRRHRQSGAAGWHKKRDGEGSSVGHSAGAQEARLLGSSDAPRPSSRHHVLSVGDACAALADSVRHGDVSAAWRSLRAIWAPVGAPFARILASGLSTYVLLRVIEEYAL